MTLSLSWTEFRLRCDQCGIVADRKAAWDHYLQEKPPSEAELQDLLSFHITPRDVTAEGVAAVCQPHDAAVAGQKLPASADTVNDRCVLPVARALHALRHP
jgi:hypothetical protein